MAHLFAADVAALTLPAGSIAASKTITGVAASSNIVTVTATSHGYSAGDVLIHESIGGATEANGVVRVASVTNANSYVIEGLTAVTTYTSGGTAKKVTFTNGTVGLLTRQNVLDLLDAFNRVVAKPSDTIAGIFVSGVNP